MSSGEESIGDLEIIEEGEDLENLENREVNQHETNENEQNVENESNTEDENKKIVKPKRIIKNPQPKLNEQTLKGPKGLDAIENYFERVKFKGRGYEEQDLNVLMKTYEYWCHRLFPKFPFDDCIARLEKLGTKKTTQTQIKRIRLGFNFDDSEKPIVSDEEANDTGGFVDTYNDQFDQLIPTTSEPVPQVTEEQLERIRQNMERAKKLREERLKQIRERAQGNLGESSLINTQSGQETEFNVHSPVDVVNSNCSQDNREVRSETNESGKEVTTDNFDVSNTIVNKDDIYKRPTTSENEFENQQENRESDIEDNLGFIREKNKKKKQVIESDGEDEILNEASENESIKNTKQILQNIENIELKNDGNARLNHDGTQSNGIHIQSEAQAMESEMEMEENDIENILNEINVDDSDVPTNENVQTVK